MDARLVELYDQDNPSGPDHDFYRALADRVGARSIADLGCGTGLLTVTFAHRGRRVVGIDPDPEMLAYARRRPGGDQVEWLLGDSRALGRLDADLVVMTGNVAQHIVGQDWPRTLSDVAAALRPGGTLAFESRNPAARAWTQWHREQTYATRDTAAGPLTEWLEVTEVADGNVTFEAHNIFAHTGEHLVSTQTLAFRSVNQTTADLTAAGLVLRQFWGGWHGQAVDAESPLLVFEAIRLRLEVGELE